MSYFGISVRNGLPIGLGNLTAFASAVNVMWTPKYLFGNGEQGLWYDPSDFSTMFQDNAGTTPVTAVEQPVGLILDKSKGLVLGPELVTNGGPFTVTTGWAARTGTTLSIDANKLKVDVDTTPSGATFDLSTVVGRYYLVRYVITIDSGTWTIQTPSPFGTPGNSTPTLTIGTHSGNLYFLANNISSSIYIRATVAGTARLISISLVEIPGNHAIQPTATKRPVLKIDGNGKYYLKFDGIDDALYTNSINFTATDKMTVVAGVRKLSDAARGMVAELSATSASSNGAFGMTAPNAASATYAFESKGTALTDAVGTPFVAPLTSVLTGIASVASDVNILRVNGTQVDSDTGDQGTGNYGNYPLYIGSRGGTSLPFNGHLYSLIVRGAQSIDAQIISAETYANQKTGAY